MPLLCAKYPVDDPSFEDTENAYIILTPDLASSSTNLEYSAQATLTQNEINLKVCNNQAGASIDDGHTQFQILVIR
jgi:hypothetical protein